MRLRTRLLIVLAAAAALSFSVWIYIVHPILIASPQIENGANMMSYVGWIEDYRKTHSVYPATLQDAVPPQNPSPYWRAARDAYDHPWHYETNGARFMLASFGRDGIHDRLPYSHTTSDLHLIKRPCYDPDIDTVYSSDGVYQKCGK